MNVDNWNGEGTLPWLYTKTATGAVGVWCCWVEGPEVCVRWGQENGAMQDARFRCEPKNVGRANATTAEEQAIKEAIAKWRKQVKKKDYHWDKTYILSAKVLKPMLAKDFHKEERKVQYPVHVQPKFDGVRCLAMRRGNTVFLQSRGGDPYTVDHIQRQLLNYLPDGIILDGELYHHGTSLQTINSWVRRPQEASINITYNVYDIFHDSDPDAPWSKRYYFLCSFFEPRSIAISHILKAQTTEVFGKDYVCYLHDEYVKLGYEGAIIRLPQGKYRFGYRSSELLKFKRFEDAEFQITGWTRGKGKFENVPIFTCVTEEGVPFECTPKGTEAERLEMLSKADSYIGKQLTVRYLDWTHDRKPRCAVGIDIREPGS